MTIDQTAGHRETASDWDAWYARNAVTIGAHDYGYEALFAKRVLPAVRGLSPREVTPQKEVLLQGRRRRIDFAVERSGLKVAIEIDGWDKTGTGTGMDRAQHQDFLERQNALVLAGWTPLRFTPREVRDSPAVVARGVEGAIERSLAATLQKVPPTSSPAERVQHLPRATANQPTVSPGSREGGAGATGSLGKWIGGALVAAVLVGLAFVSFGSGGAQSVSCSNGGVVRGNVSQSGERIYHLPGDRYYEATNPEECFADSADAEAEGYRRAKV